MKVPILVLADITLVDERLIDPDPGDPLHERMRTSAVEAIANALSHVEAEGFEHDLGDITAVLIDDVRIAGLYG